jgi:hypothetical protein
VFGVFNGQSFTPTEAIDIHALDEDQWLDEFNLAVPGIGRDVRYFVADQEVEPIALVPGQPYSVYPKQFRRSGEERATVADPVQPIRFEGPMINIQWAVLDVDRNPIGLPGNGKVPAEITLLQLWKIVLKAPTPALQIMWGNHLRSGDIIESGRVTTLEEADFVEILVDSGAAPTLTHIDVRYAIGSEVFSTRVRKDATIGDLKESLTYVHRGRQIQAIAFEGADIDQADPVDDWMGRPLNHPLVVRVAAPVAAPAAAPAPKSPVAPVAPVAPGTVNVLLDFRGVQHQFSVDEKIKKKDFKREAKRRLGISAMTHTRIELLGADEWSLREGHCYAVYETREMRIKLHDVNGQIRRMNVAGDKSAFEVAEILRGLWNLKPWIKITVKRKDGRPFYLEDEGHYDVLTQEDPDADPRKVCTIRVDLMDRTFIIPDYRAVPDTAALWTDLCAKFGFQAVNVTQMHVSGNPDAGQVTFAMKIPVSCSKVKLPHYLRRTVEAFIAADPWKSEELILPAMMGKDEIWKHLQTLTPLPHHSQFQIISGRNDISAAKTWPAGHIMLNPLKFPVTWKLEWPQEPTGILEVIQPNMTAMHDVQEAWRSLHTMVPGLYERSILNYRGNLQPGQTIQAGAAREEVTVGIRFEVANKGWIRFSQQRTQNMSPRSEIHARYIKADTRIPPLACYVREETRPYHEEDLIAFGLRQDVVIPDLSGNEGGAAGGDNGRGLVLPAIEYPAPVIDVSKGKVQGGRTSAIEGVEPGPDSDDSCATDSGEDEEGTDAHKLVQIAQAIHKAQPVTVANRGQFKGFQGEQVEIVFQRDHVDPAPDDLRELWREGMSGIVGLSNYYLADELSNALLWSQVDIPREHMDIAVAKVGVGVVVTFTHKGYPGRMMSTLPESYVVPLVKGWAVSFGAQQGAADMELTQYLADATSPWNQTLELYGKPWQVYLSSADCREGLQGEVLLKALPAPPPGKAPLAPNQQIPWVAVPPRTYIEATRPKEIRAMLRFGRDSQWPLKITFASALDEHSSMSVTYALEWDGLEWGDDEDSDERVRNWFTQRFMEKAYEDGLIQPPGWTRPGSALMMDVRKENSEFRVVIRENNAALNIRSPEMPGPPPFLFYGPKAEIKIRPPSLQSLERWMSILYPNGMQITEKLATNEWAIIGAFNGGKTPESHKLVLTDPDKAAPEAWNTAILEAGLRTQNYDKGFDRFIRKFNPGVQMSAVMAIESGAHSEFGAAILFTQENRRCLLLETLHVESEADALWYTMLRWARFQPRATRPKSDAGQLFYPAAYSHVFEKYWDVLEQPLAHEDVASESFFTKACMQKYAAALRGHKLPQTPLVDSEAPEGCQIIAKQAAWSRLCMIQDAHNFWAEVSHEEHRSSACTDGPVSLGGSVVGTESGPGLGSTDTCVPCGHPSQT